MSLTAFWVVLAVLRLLTHEMWRDELQAWMIARGSDTLGELLSNLRYEGHPGLWAVLLFLVSRVTDSPLGMQAVNLAVGSASAYLLLRYAPFPRWITVAIAFGYFVAYEYGTLSRNYGLGVLGIFGFCALFANARRHRTLLMGGTLALLALTSIYGVIAAAGLAAGALWDGWMNRPVAGPGHRRRAAGFAALVAVGMLGTLLFVRQPADTGFSISPRLTLDVDVGLHTLGSVWRGLAPIPPVERQFWNRDILEPLPLVRSAAGLALFGLTLLILRSSPTALVTFAVGSTGMLAFSYLIYTGGVRHHGHHFLLVTAACWIAATTTREPGLTLPPWRRLLASLAVVQLGVGAFASLMDLRLTFSGSRDAASYIQAHYSRDVPIVVDPELPGVPVAAWLERDVFFAQSDRIGGFVIWNNQRRSPDLDRAVAAADRLSAASGREVLLVTTHQKRPPPAYRHLGRFPGQIVAEETYDLYVREARASGP